MSRPRLALLAASGLAVALLPLGVTAPTGAAVSALAVCLDETMPGPLPGLNDGCDDATQPDTRLASSVATTASGFVATSQITFSASALVGDADPGPFALECRLVGPAQAHDWRACTSPVTYSGLVDSGGVAYTFAVRAVDSADRARNPDNGLPPLVADTPDLDQSPATFSWGQDTTVPVAFVNPDVYDAETPTQPVVADRTVPFRLNSNEGGVRFQCQDDAKPVACSSGRWQLTRAASGRHSFTARAIDKAGNASAWSTPFEFQVPKNLGRAKGWKKKVGASYFDGDVLTSTTRRARIVLPKQQVGELRLYAPTAPSYGKVRVKVGSTSWRVVDLGRAKSAQREFIVIDRYEGTRVGKIYLEVLSRRKPVFLDAIVARTNVFPG